MRDDWTFAYTREEVIEAAKKRITAKYQSESNATDTADRHPEGSPGENKMMQFAQEQRTMAEEYEQWVRLLEMNEKIEESVGEEPDGRSWTVFHERSSKVLRLTRDDINYFGLDQ